jgi:RNA polymerase sigma-70 factor, ECF subfamily
LNISAKDRPLEQIAISDEFDDLLTGLRHRQPWAYTTLVERFATPLHGYAAFLLANDSELAEEVVLRALADAVRNIGRFDEKKSALPTWLYAIVRRQALQEQRKAHRKKSVPACVQVSLETADTSLEVDTTSGIAGHIDAQRELTKLRRILSAEEMEVLMLHYIDELEVKEIGHILVRSEPAVHSLLHRAKQKARAHLENDHA